MRRSHALLLALLMLLVGLVVGGPVVAAAATSNDAACRKGLSGKSSPTHKDLLRYETCRADLQDASLKRIEAQLAALVPATAPSSPTAPASASAVPSPTQTGVVAPSTPSSAPGAKGYWRSAFESGSALTPTSGSPAPGAEWSGWGQGDTSTYGVPHLVSAKAEGLPTPPSGDRVLKLRHSGPQSPFGADQEIGAHNMHKLYKQFTAKTWPSGAEPTNREDGTPDDVSGRYLTTLYIPSAQMRGVRGYWSNIMQFKEDYRDSAGGFNSNPSWWVGLNFFDPAHPVVNLSSSGGRHVGPSIPLSTIEDRWVQMELRVYQHDRIEWYVDGKLLDTGRSSETTVGRANYVGQRGTSGSTVAKTLGWTFGVGNYTNGNDYPAAASGVYVDVSEVLPLR